MIAIDAAGEFTEDRDFISALYGTPAVRYYQNAGPGAPLPAWVRRFDGLWARRHSWHYTHVSAVLASTRIMPWTAGSAVPTLWHHPGADYEASVHVVVPKIETAARALLRELDEGIYRLQVAKDPGQYPSLYVLLHELEDLALDESWAYYLRWLLPGPLGMNLRNEVAHGFVTDISPVYAALTLRAAALLITVVAPQPPSAARAAGRENDHAVDLAELPRRDRDEILQILRMPVRDPVPLPGRGGTVGRLAGLTASTLRTAASSLNLLARRLDP